MSTTVHFDRSISLQALEGNQAALESDTVTFNCIFTATVSSVGTVACYVNKQDKASTLMPSGSVTVSGNTVTLKPLVISALSGVGGKQIIIGIPATISSDVLTFQIVVDVRKKDR